MEAVQNIDLSRLQQHAPNKELHLSLLDLMKYVSVGTTELLLYLLKETHIILECRTCSNLFRDVPYFVAHKRIYCKQRHDNDLDIQTVCPHPPEDEEKASVSVKPNIYEDHKEFLQHSVDLAKKVLQSSQVNHCTQVLRKNGPTKAQFYDAVQKQLEIARENAPPTQLFSLEPIENTQVAMKVIPNDGTDSAMESTTEGADPNKEPQGGANLADVKTESVDKFSAPPASVIPSGADIKVSPEVDKQFLKRGLADFKKCICLKCNRTMASQKVLGDHLLTVHAEELKEKSDICCASPSCSNSEQCQPMNGIRPKVNKTDWLKPRGYASSEKTNNNKPNPANASAKEVLDAKKKAQANLLALKEEQLAYENEILQQKLIRGIMPKSSRGRKKFRCESCGKIFPKIESLRDHLRDCIDWEHVNQPIRNVRSPLPTSLKDSTNSFDWPDTTNSDAACKEQQPPKLQPQPQVKIEPVRPPLPPPPPAPPRAIAPKVTPMPHLSDQTKINGTLNNISNSMMTAKLGDNKVLLVPIESVNPSHHHHHHHHQNLSLAMKGQPQPPTVLLKQIPNTLNVIPVSICPVNNNNNNNSNNKNMLTQVPLIAPKTPGMAPLGSFQSKDVEIIAVKNNPNVPSPYPELRSIVTPQCWPENLNSCPEPGALGSENTGVPSVVASRPLPPLTPCPITVSATNCPSAVCCKSCCNNDVQVLEHLSTAAVPKCAASSGTESEDVIVVSQSFTNSFSSELPPPPYLTAPNSHMTKPPLDKNVTEKPQVPLLGFGNQCLVPVPSKEHQLTRKPLLNNSSRKSIKWKRYKCRLCVYSASKRHLCKLHVRQLHMCQLFTRSLKSLSHCVVDLKSFVRRRTSRVGQWSKTSSSTKKRVKEKRRQRNRLRPAPPHCRRPLSLSKTRVSMDSLIDPKRQVCLKCNRTFQVMSRLKQHVTCHLGWTMKRSQVKCEPQQQSDSLLRCNESEQQSDCVIVDLTQDQQQQPQQQQQESNCKDCCSSDGGASSSISSSSSSSSSSSDNVTDSSGICSTAQWNGEPSGAVCNSRGQLCVLNTRKGSYQKPQNLPETKPKILRRNIK